MSWGDDNKHRVILDIGSQIIKAGLADSNLPQYKIENLAGTKLYYFKTFNPI